MDESEERKIEGITPKKKRYHETMRENPWIVSTFVLGLLVVIMLVGSFSGKLTGSTVSESKAGEILVDLAKAQIGDIKIIDVEKESGLYKITYSSERGDGVVYLTLNGKNLVNGLIPLPTEEEEESSETGAQDVSKSDKPVVELFVMSHCPYGTQAEKGILPVVELLGDKIDFNLRFVYYAMHPSYGEVEEQLNQYCIQKEQEDKFIDYLKCFLGKTGTPEDGEVCLREVRINQAQLSSCISKTDNEFEVSKNKNDQSKWLSGRYPLFNIDKFLNEEYGIGGSPTLVINGQIVSSGRAPASYLDVICQAFVNVPEECGTQLSTTSYSAGFGYEGTGSSTTAQCG